MPRRVAEDELLRDEFGDWRYAVDTAAWQSVFACPLFWSRYFWVSHRFPELGGAYQPPDDYIELAFPPAPSLFLSIGGEITLYVERIDARSTETQLGWEDNCHGHAHVFRWAECVALSRYLADRQFAEEHPANALLLLTLFAPITTQDRVSAEPLIRLALRKNGITGSLADAIVDSSSIADDDFGWVCDDQGRWGCTGNAAASLRLIENDTFPHKAIQGIFESVQEAGYSISSQR